MQWLRTIKNSLIFGFLILSLCGFRTPSKIYAGAFTVKLQVKQDLTEYDIPVWIKPDQAESSLDPTLMKELGYQKQKFTFDEVHLAGIKLEQKNFKSLKSEWAFVPDFAKSCCHGVIGRDILEKFEIRFDPKEPSHLEWTKLPKVSDVISYTPAFLNSLKLVFSLEKPTNVPFVLNLREKKLNYEAKIKASEPALFSFFFFPPDRFLRVTSISAKDSSAAKKVGFVAGMIITSINGEEVSGLDRWVIEKYIRGEKVNVLKMLTSSKKEFVYDFSSRQFK